MLVVEGSDETSLEGPIHQHLLPESLTQTALETGIKNQTQIDLSDHLRSFNKTGDSNWEFTGSDTNCSAVLIFCKKKKPHLPGVLIGRSCSFKNSFGGTIKLPPLKQQELTMT